VSATNGVSCAPEVVPEPIRVPLFNKLTHAGICAKLLLVETPS
jgi:hypothetical protein